jgi:hypothetical protein
MKIPPFTPSVIAPYSALPMTRGHTEDMARRVERAWHKCGHTQVRAWVIEEPKYKGAAIWGIRSNLVGGLPPKAAA